MEVPKVDNIEHELFCLYFFELGDKVEAYYKVYGSDIKRVSAIRSASRILVREDVRKYISYLIRCNLDEVEISMNLSRLLEELMKMALSPDHMYPAQKLTAIITALDLLGAQGESLAKEIEKHRLGLDTILNKNKSLDSNGSKGKKSSKASKKVD